MGNCCSRNKTRGSRTQMDTYIPSAKPTLNTFDENKFTNLSSTTTHNNDKEMKKFDTEPLKHALGEEFEEEYEDSDTTADEDDDIEIDEGENASLSPRSRNNQGNIVVPVHALRKQASSGKNFPNFKKPLSAIPVHLRLEGFSRTKHNSTSSLYINTTLSKPDTDEVLRCMGQAILYHIEKGMASPHKTFFDIFTEEKYPITKAPVDTKSMPTAEIIYSFIATIFRAERLDAECAIMCLAYIERIISLTGLSMDPSNWRRVVLSALILASKVWEDQSVWNVDFLPVFDNLTAADLNKLERQFLALLQYNVSLNASLYAKYYFELRTFSKLDPQNFPLQPLDKLSATRLESHSQASEQRVRTFKRSASVDQLTPVEPHTPIVIN